MWKTLMLGLRLKCPNCGQGSISDKLLEINETCDVCQVRFERRSGESSGASMIALSVLPIPGLIIGFLMMAINPNLPLWFVLGLPSFIIIAMSVFGYRHIRGLWIAIVKLTDGLYPDNESAETQL